MLLQLVQAKTTGNGNMNSTDQMATMRDHGGELMRVVVQEIGYGSAKPTVYMDGTLLPESS